MKFIRTKKRTKKRKKNYFAYACKSTCKGELNRERARSNSGKCGSWGVHFACCRLTWSLRVCLSGRPNRIPNRLSNRMNVQRSYSLQFTRRSTRVLFRHYTRHFTRLVSCLLFSSLLLLRFLLRFLFFVSSSSFVTFFFHRMRPSSVVISVCLTPCISPFPLYTIPAFSASLLHSLSLLLFFLLFGLSLFLYPSWFFAPFSPSLISPSPISPSLISPSLFFVSSRPRVQDQTFLSKSSRASWTSPCLTFVL